MEGADGMAPIQPPYPPVARIALSAAPLQPYSDRMSDHVEVMGSGSAGAVPDVVVLDVRVQAEAADVGAALGRASTATGDLLAVAAASGIADADRRTTGMGVSTRWDREGRGVVGYTAFQTLRLLVRDRDATSELLPRLAGAAGDTFGLDGVSLEVADPGPLHERARAAAFADARARAEQYAALAGRPLGPVLRVTEAPAGPGPAPKLRAMAADAMAAMPVEPGESEVSASVLVRFGLGAP